MVSLGNMKGATSTKFGVYYGRLGEDTEQKYRFTKKFGDDLDTAFFNVKKNITNLLIAGQAGDEKEITDNKIGALFKYKLLGSYFPDKYLNLY